MKEKFLFLFLFFLLFFPVAFSLSVEPFVAFQGEKVVLDLEGKKAESALIEAYYNEKEFIECAETLCPEFENKKQEIMLEGKTNAVINVGNARHGDYLIRVKLEDGSVLLTSFVVKPNYSVLIVSFIVLLMALLYWSERNARKKPLV